MHWAISSVIITQVATCDGLSGAGGSEVLGGVVAVASAQYGDKGDCKDWSRPGLIG